MRTLRDLDGAVPTVEQQQLLARWSGWGAVPEVFKADDERFASERAELQQLLSEPDYAAARRATLNAHYTDAEVIAPVWDAVQALGITEGHVLEPGCGSGNFIGFAPEAMQISGVEWDPTTAAIAAALYPQATILDASFADLIPAHAGDERGTDDAAEDGERVEPDGFDAVVGNVPFGRLRLYDPDYNDELYSIHNHFILKSLRLTRPGGIVAVLTSRYTLDAQDPTVRDEIGQLGELISAVRLPTGAFQRSAGTEVITDLLLLRRRDTDPTAAGAAGWRGLREIRVRDRANRRVPLEVNEYFQRHPDHVLGEPGAASTRFREQDLVITRPDTDLGAALRAVLTADVADAHERGLAATPSIPSTVPFTLRPREGLDKNREGSLALDEPAPNQPDAQPTFRRWSRGRWEPYAPPAKQVHELAALLRIRDTTVELLAAEQSTCPPPDGTSTPASETEPDSSATADTAGFTEADVTALRARLNEHYDAYVARYGPVRRFTWRVANAPAWNVFSRWCKESEPPLASMPAERSTVMRYLRHLGEAGCGAERLTAHLDAITRRHRAKEQPLDEQLIQHAHELIADHPEHDHADLNLDELGLRVQSKLVPPQGGFRGDPHAARVHALEDYDSVTKTATKDAIFTERVVVPIIPRERADSPTDAVSLCLNQHGRLRLDVIATLLDLPGEDEALATLGELVFTEPDTGQVVLRNDYLSGNVRRKLAVAESAVQRHPRWQTNVDALHTVVPPMLGPQDIKVQLGSWIDARYIQQFIRELIGDDTVRVDHPGPDVWVVQGGVGTSAAREQWGTPHRRPQELLEAILTGRPIRITYTDSQGNTRVDRAATAAAKRKADQMTKRFRNWVWEDTERAEDLVQTYNNLHNAKIPRSYDDIDIDPPGLSSTTTLFPWQRTAVAAQIFNPSFGLFHEVGAGKTLEMIVGAMECRRLGLTQRQVVVVPNHMLEEFTSQWLRFCPRADLLAASSKDLSGRNRQVFIARILHGHHDAVIMSRGAFRALRVSSETEHAYHAAQRNEIVAALAVAKEHGCHERTIKELEEAQAQATESLKKRMAGIPRDRGVCWEDLGVDKVIIDEAQDFKNDRRFSVLPDMAHPGSARAIDLDMKLDQIAAHHGHRRNILATATPWTNSLAEVHTVARRLGAPVGHLDTMMRTFGEVRTTQEMVPGGGFKNKSRLRTLINVPDLYRLLRLSADIRTADDLDLPTPTVRASIIEVPTSPELQVFNQLLGGRYDRMPARPKKGDDNHLSLLTEGIAAATDLRLIGWHTDQPQKVDVLAGRIIDRWIDHRDTRYLRRDGSEHPRPGGLQLVFCSLSVPKPGWNFYDELRDRLAAAGMPREMVRFIHEANTDEKLASLFASARSGEIAVLIGSAEKMGTGVNVQDRALGLYRVDPPWRPDIPHQQRGRVERRGNQNPEVFDETLITVPSLEAKRWEIVRQKWGGFRPLMTGKFTGRVIELADDAMDLYTELMIVGTGDPRQKELRDLETQVDSLSDEKSYWERTQSARRLAILVAENRIPQCREQIAQIDAAIERRVDTSADNFVLITDTASYTSRTDAANHATSVLTRRLAQLDDGQTESVAIGTLGGLPLYATVTGGDGQVVAHFGGIPDPPELLVDDLPLNHQWIQGQERRLTNLENHRSDLEHEVTRLAQKADEARRYVDEPFAEQAELDDAERRLEQLHTELDKKHAAADDADTANGDPADSEEPSPHHETDDPQTDEEPNTDPLAGDDPAAEHAPEPRTTRHDPDTNLTPSHLPAEPASSTAPSTGAAGDSDMERTARHDQNHAPKPLGKQEKQSSTTLGTYEGETPDTGPVSPSVDTAHENHTVGTSTVADEVAEPTGSDLDPATHPARDPDADTAQSTSPDPPSEEEQPSPSAEPEERFLRLHYSHEHGAQLLDTAKTDPIGENLRPLRGGWKWRQIINVDGERGAWLLPKTWKVPLDDPRKASRFYDRLWYRLPQAALALRRAGFSVVFDLPDLPESERERFDRWRASHPLTNAEANQRQRRTDEVTSAFRDTAFLDALWNHLDNPALLDRLWLSFVREHDSALTASTARAQTVAPLADVVSDYIVDSHHPVDRAQRRALEVFVHLLHEGQSAGREDDTIAAAIASIDSERAPTLVGYLAATGHTLHHRIVEQGGNFARLFVTTGLSAVSRSLIEASHALADKTDIDLPTDHPQRVGQAPALGEVGYPPVRSWELGADLGLRGLPEPIHRLLRHSWTEARSALLNTGTQPFTATLMATVWQRAHGILDSEHARSILDQARDKTPELVDATVPTTAGSDGAVIIRARDDAQPITITRIDIGIDGRLHLRGHLPGADDVDAVVVLAHPGTHRDPASGVLTAAPDTTIEIAECELLSASTTAESPHSTVEKEHRGQEEEHVAPRRDHQPPTTPPDAPTETPADNAPAPSTPPAEADSPATDHAEAPESREDLSDGDTDTETTNTDVRQDEPAPDVTATDNPLPELGLSPVTDITTSLVGLNVRTPTDLFVESVSPVEQGGFLLRGQTGHGARRTAQFDADQWFDHQSRQFLPSAEARQLLRQWSELTARATAHGYRIEHERSPRNAGYRPDDGLIALHSQQTPAQRVRTLTDLLNGLAPVAESTPTLTNANTRRRQAPQAQASEPLILDLFSTHDSASPISDPAPAIIDPAEEDTTAPEQNAHPATAPEFVPIGHDTGPVANEPAPAHSTSPQVPGAPDYLGDGPQSSGEHTDTEPGGQEPAEPQETVTDTTAVSSGTTGPGEAIAAADEDEQPWQADHEFPVVEGIDSEHRLDPAQWGWSGFTDEPTETGYHQGWWRNDLRLALNYDIEDRLLCEVHVFDDSLGSDAEWIEINPALTSTRAAVEQLLSGLGRYGAATPTRDPLRWAIRPLLDPRVVDVPADPDSSVPVVFADPGEAEVVFGPGVRCVERDDDRWWFTDTREPVQRAPYVVVPKFTKPADLANYILDSSARDQQTAQRRAWVRVILTGRARNGIRPNQARASLATADMPALRRALTATVGRRATLADFDLERARTALRRLANDDPTLPINSHGQHIALPDTEPGVVTAVTPRETDVLITLDHSAELGGTATIAQHTTHVLDIDSTLHLQPSPTHSSTTAPTSTAPEIHAPIPVTEVGASNTDAGAQRPEEQAPHVPETATPQAEGLFAIAPPERGTADHQPETTLPPAHSPDAASESAAADGAVVTPNPEQRSIRVGSLFASSGTERLSGDDRAEPLTDEDIAHGVRHMGPSNVRAFLRSAAAGSPANPTHFSTWLGWRDPHEADAGARDEGALIRQGLELAVRTETHTRRGRISWSMLARWLAPGVGGPAGTVLGHATTAQISFAHNRRGFSAIGESDWADAADIELDEIADEAVSEIVEQALTAHRSGTAPGPRARNGATLRPIRSADDQHLDGVHGERIARIDALTGVLPEQRPKRWRSLDDLHVGDVFAHPGYGFAPFRVDHLPVPDGDDLRVDGRVLGSRRDDTTGIDASFILARDGQPRGKVELIAFPTSLVGLIEPLREPEEPEATDDAESEQTATEDHLGDGVTTEDAAEESDLEPDPHATQQPGSAFATPDTERLSTGEDHAQPLTDEDIAHGVRRMGTNNLRQFLHKAAAGKPENPTLGSGWRVTRKAADPDAGAADDGELTRHGLELAVTTPTHTRRGRVSWRMLARWIAPGTGGPASTVLDHAETALSGFAHNQDGFSAIGESDWARAAEIEIRSIANDAANEIVEHALNAHRNGTAPGPRARNGATLPPIRSATDQQLDGVHGDRTARIDTLTSVLPATQPTQRRRPTELHIGDVFQHPGYGFAPFRVDHPATVDGDTLTVRGRVLSNRPDDATGIDVTITFDRDEQSVNDIKLIAMPTSLVGLVEPLRAHPRDTTPAEPARSAGAEHGTTEQHPVDTPEPDADTTIDTGEGPTTADEGQESRDEDPPDHLIHLDAAPARDSATTTPTPTGTPKREPAPPTDDDIAHALRHLQPREALDLALAAARGRAWRPHSERGWHGPRGVHETDPGAHTDITITQRELKLRVETDSQVRAGAVSWRTLSGWLRHGLDDDAVTVLARVDNALDRFALYQQEFTAIGEHDLAVSATRELELIAEHTTLYAIDTALATRPSDTTTASAATPPLWLPDSDPAARPSGLLGERLDRIDALTSVLPAEDEVNLVPSVQLRAGDIVAHHERGQAPFRLDQPPADQGDRIILRGTLLAPGVDDEPEHTEWHLPHQATGDDTGIVLAKIDLPTSLTTVLGEPPRATATPATSTPTRPAAPSELAPAVPTEQRPHTPNVGEPTAHRSDHTSPADTPNDTASNAGPTADPPRTANPHTPVTRSDAQPPARHGASAGADSTDQLTAYHTTEHGAVPGSTQRPPEQALPRPASDSPSSGSADRDSEMAAIHEWSDLITAASEHGYRVVTTWDGASRIDHDAKVIRIAPNSAPGPRAADLRQHLDQLRHHLTDPKQQPTTTPVATSTPPVEPENKQSTTRKTPPRTSKTTDSTTRPTAALTSLNQEVGDAPSADHPSGLGTASSRRNRHTTPRPTEVSGQRPAFPAALLDAEPHPSSAEPTMPFPSALLAAEIPTPAAPNIPVPTDMAPHSPDPEGNTPIYDALVAAHHQPSPTSDQTPRSHERTGSLATVTRLPVRDDTTTGHHRPSQGDHTTRRWWPQRHSR